LLVWADKVSAEPSGRKSAFFEAKRTNLQAFRRLEWAKRHTFQATIEVKRWALVTIAVISSLGAISALVRETADNRAALAHPYGVWNIPLILTSVALSYVLLALLSRFKSLRFTSNEQVADLGCFAFLLLSVPLFLIASAMLPLASWSIVAYLLIGGVASYVLLLLPTTNLAGYRRTFYIPRLNPFLGLYQDPTCRHWIAVQSEQQRFRIGKGSLKLEKLEPEEIGRGSTKDRVTGKS
jgi:hypothetical protein